MTNEELKELKKDVSTKKRIATEWASKIHDVVEDGLWTEYSTLPQLASDAVAACEAWKSAAETYEAAQKSAESA
ncbi:CCE_0567 family metalloprotein [Thalassolituus sp.]|jgi:hypothetical protein|uniref:CCE_0567 family metalloprotein n=1 Tax=Thalassolituus sp. TaxID=2030822 RepID=UPI002A833A58|nr:CCE_0567 family metalloprotein [Thalassolituus sp.]|tara:strand:- start:12924 stop:13145 length:222 start_codon:yes stop_codon:yes gene_type:complete